VLASRYPRRGTGGVTITLIESRQQPPIGVGEGTWPTIRTTLNRSASPKLTSCASAMPLSSKDRNSSTGSAPAIRTPTGTRLPCPLTTQTGNLAPYWLEGAQQPGFAPSLCFQTELCTRGLGAEADHDTEFAGLANYAYHLDAGKFAPFLQRHCVGKLGVSHVYDEIVAGSVR